MQKIFKILLPILIVIGLAIFVFIYYHYINKELIFDKTKINYISLGETIILDGDGMSLTNNTVTISYGGTFEISGTSDNVNIVINSKDNNPVNLILNDVKITSQSGTPILINQAKKVIVTLSGENYISDTSNNRNDNEDAVIVSHDNLYFTGDGSLNIEANYNDAIASKDQLVINSGTYVIKANDDAIKGKDYLEINGGTFDINCGGDALKATNEEDTELGYILINDGTFKIKATGDGIQTVNYLTIKNGTFNIETGNNASSDISSKALKATNNIIIENGTFDINSLDDSIHSNNKIVINNGSFNLSSGDDGIHADTSIIINNGEFNIIKSYEGIESALVEINDGTIKVVANDDGINIAGGNDSSSMNRPGANNINTSNNQKLTINGGTIEVDAAGDGLDANGSIYINGGTVTVNGPTNDGNGSLDFDGEFIITGGTLIASGSSGMLQTPSSNSSQYVIAAVFTSTTNNIIIKDSVGNTIVNFTPSKKTASIVYSSDKIEANGTYSVYIGDTLLGSVNITSKVNSIGTSNNQIGGFRR